MFVQRELEANELVVSNERLYTLQADTETYLGLARGLTRANVDSLLSASNQLRTIGYATDLYAHKLVEAACFSLKHPGSNTVAEMEPSLRLLQSGMDAVPFNSEIQMVMLFSLSMSFTFMCVC